MEYKYLLLDKASNRLVIRSIAGFQSPITINTDTGYDSDDYYWVNVTDMDPLEVDKLLKGDFVRIPPPGEIIPKEGINVVVTDGVWGVYKSEIEESVEETPEQIRARKISSKQSIIRNLQREILVLSDLVSYAPLTDKMKKDIIATVDMNIKSRDKAIGELEKLGG